ncbi:MAG: conjugal transfer protein TraF [Rhodothermales bacterium]
MNRHTIFRSALLCALFLSLSWTVEAQQRVPGTRAFVPSPQVLGMGGAAAAYPTTRTALFYNPAHLTHLRVTRAPITMLGLSASISNNFPNQLDFYNDRLEPAIQEGIENLNEEDEQTLYEDVFREAGTPTVLSGDVLLPSFVLNRGAFGVGGGIFAHSEVAYSVEDAGAGVPGVDFTALVDLMAVAAGAVDFAPLGLKGLSAGVTSKYSQRYLSLKVKPVDAIDDDESLYVLGASSFGVDVGLLYSANLSIPGQLNFGVVWSDLTLKNYDYSFTAYYTKNEEVRDDRAIATEVALAQERYQLSPTFRAGVAYVLPVLAGPLKETAVALDYIRYEDALVDQPVLGQLSLGLQTTLGKTLSLRTGLNQGYTTFGAGLQLSFVRIDYAYYGSEQGRLPGQSASWHHRVQVSLGSF